MSRKMLARYLMGHVKSTRFYSTTIDSQEMNHFKKYVDVWWNEFGEMKPLHSMNKIRVPWIRESLLSNKKIEDPTLPLKGLSILDVGCGGGVLTESLAKIGANITGLDANKELIESAKSHAQENCVKINYIATSIEDHAVNNVEKYDAIIASEVIEHITNKNDFIKACIQCLKPKGYIFVTTINKNWQSNLACIFISENVLQLIPKGTHHFDKLISPNELQRILEENNCRTEIVHGTMYNFITNTWYWCSDPTLTYALKAIKLEE